MNDFLKLAGEVHALMQGRGQLVFSARSARLEHFLHVITVTTAYIRNAHTEGRFSDTERNLADSWETVVLDAAVEAPQFALVCGDIVNFWRELGAYVRDKPFAESALMFLAMKFTRFE